MCTECGNTCSVCFIPSEYVLEEDDVEAFACEEHFDQVKAMLVDFCKTRRRRAAAPWN